MSHPPVFTSTSPHLFDHSADQYALDYSFGKDQPFAVFALMYCMWCGKKYAVAPQVGFWVLFPYESHGDMNSIVGRVSGDWPVCIDPKCVSSQGAAKNLTVLASHAVVTSEGEWLNLGRRVES